MRFMQGDLKDTPFSSHRLIIWGMFINLLLIVVGLIILLWQGKDSMPLGALAGSIVGYFTAKGSQKEKIACGVCGTTADYHTGEQCAIGLAARLKSSV